MLQQFLGLPANSTNSITYFMKNRNFSTWMVAIMVLLAITTGCKKPCKDTECANGACLEGNCLCNDGWTGPNCDQRDQCANRSCGFGYCNDGACVCDPGYEGVGCIDAVSYKFSGAYTASDSSYLTFISPSVYTLNVIISSNGPTLLYIDDLTGNSYYFEATVGADNYSITAANQPLSGFWGIKEFTGRLSPTKNELTLDYKLYDNDMDTLVDHRKTKAIKF